jgi:hypothetical protein
MRPHNTRKEFDRCWDWLDASLASFGRTHTRDQVWEQIQHERATLWPGANAVILTNVINFPIGLRACNVWLQGGELEELKHMHPHIEQWAQDERGCQRMIAWGRNGWLRALDGYEPCGTRRAKWLTEVPEFLRATKA